jgi:hypothetical protein
VQIVPFDSVGEKVHVSPRPGDQYIRELLKGEENSADNFILNLYRIAPDFSSPRHRHPYEQVRLHLDGVAQWPEGSLKSPKVVYVGDSTYYGPHRADKEGYNLALLQWGNHYMSFDQLERAITALKKKGEIKDGVFTWYEDGHKHNQDAYEAALQEHRGQKVTYAKPAYDRAILIDPEAFEWVPVNRAAGVYEKALGQFNQRRTSIAFLKIESKVQHKLIAQLDTVVLVARGAGEAGGKTLGRLSAVHLRMQEEMTFSATEETELFIVEKGYSVAPGRA